ncbi:hypothetical protein PsorP6_005462 [Peronosclerospora sorghi]|uniref:Uncharacterized protein n=1 Tax=Peronosclerospora sorghi TaxID=230839 RepID=A0ACC0W3R8_9STRA|nr:hypothetical protein PsorP6_005462 [Peronosclerospora sorghi]
MSEILDNDQFVDVLDECDALLHHKYHLVYAVGLPFNFVAESSGGMAAQALLRLVADEIAGPRVHKVLEAPHVSCSAPDYATRLSAVVQSTEHLRKEFKEALVLDLIASGPFELMWLTTIGGGSAREALVRALTNSSVSLEEALGDHMPKLAPSRSIWRAGALMEKRNRVDFGLPAVGTRQKKIAIPYRAADVPSERSEFSHPDVCIVLTLLGYYHSGLREGEVKNTFKMLLRLSLSEQDQEYMRWFESVKARLKADELSALGDVGKSTVCLGLIGTLLCTGYTASDVAYIKPATQCEKPQLVTKFCRQEGITCVEAGPIVFYRGFTR